LQTEKAEKIRMYQLARELGWESKDLLALCREHGIDIKNQLSAIEPEMREQIAQLARRKSAAPSTAVAPSQTVKTGVLDQKVKVLETPRRPSRPSVTEAKAPAVPQQPPAAELAVPPPVVEVGAVAPPQPAPPAVEPSAPSAAPEAAPAVPLSKTPEAPPAPRPAPERPPETPTVQTPPPTAPRAPETPAARTPEAPSAPPAAAKPPTPPATRRPGLIAPRPTSVPPLGGGVPNLGGGSRTAERPRKGPTPGFRPGGVGPVPPPPLKTPQPKPQEKKPKPEGPRKIAEIPDTLKSAGGEVTMREVLTEIQRQQTGRGGPVVVPPEADIDEEMEGEEGKGKGGPRRIGVGVVGREARHKVRAERQAKRKSGEPELKTVRGIGGVAVVDEEERVRTRHPKLRKLKHKGPQPRKGKVPIQLPITVRSLSEAIGVRVNDLIKKLMDTGMLVTINSLVEPDIAETLALEHGCELDVKRQLDAEDRVLAEQQKPDRPEDLVPRAPVVTIMGHVDHGKTSLLDRIRRTYGMQSDVVSTEAGGITQVLRAWRVEKDGKSITFLDTPGHEAFTKMRARGANVTDIAVIVVAADDGVMPQTEEAISHAKAAEVKMVVAINKVDLPNANIKKTEQQLYGLGLIPDTMGGETPFVQTSAATGKGIDDLLEAISLVAEYHQDELRANPNKPASGTCLEAYLSEEEGVLATVLVQDGTLHQGDVVVCGASYGRVRAMYNDLGRPIAEAGPSVPARITGLDEVPNADDPFLVVPDLSMAREVAEKRKDRQQEAAQVGRKPLSLEDLAAAKVAELKVILKAEARGSIEAIRKELEKLQHEEVRVRVLHAAIGGISESDVQLALTSPQDTLILGFNVVPDERAQALAEERGVSIRQYNIIYKLTDDVRSALEGKLKPREEVIHLGRAVVRNTFKISRVGTIAGCYVTQGIIERSAKVRVIRQGVVVYPPADRSVGLESLRRYKEDVREVREGFECGLKIAGYDDVKVDDVIEAYRVEQVQRKLE
jgi:translation initiation factor IF-2